MSKDVIWHKYLFMFFMTCVLVILKTSFFLHVAYPLFQYYCMSISNNITNIKI